MGGSSVMNDSSGPDTGRGSVPETGMGSGHIATSVFERKITRDYFTALLRLK